MYNKENQLIALRRLAKEKYIKLEPSDQYQVLTRYRGKAKNITFNIILKSLNLRDMKELEKTLERMLRRS